MNFRLTNSCIAFAFQIALILPVIATPSATAAPQTTETTPQTDGNQKLNQLIQTATRTQASGDLKQAATQWQAVWQQFPDSQLAGPARFQAGFCHQQLKDYPQAIEHLKAAIPNLAAANEQLPTAKFYLGYCQFQLGQQNLRTATDATVRKQATDLVATATVTLQRLLKTHPSFPDTVQAYYFLGGCFEELGRKQDAIDAYQQMANVPNPNDVFKYESTFAIADLNFELGQYGQAKQYFDKLLTDPNNKQRPDRNLVVYTAAETSIALGTAAKQNGIGQSSKQHFADAEALLKTIVQPTTDDKPAVLLAREAQRQLAFCYQQQNRFQTAGDAYASIYQTLTAADPQALKIQTATNAGSSYLNAGDPEQGQAFLKLATRNVSPNSAKAARLLSAFYLNQQQFDNAYDLTTKFIPVAQPPNLVPLKLNQANAAASINGKFDQATALFKSIATNFPDHELASVALQNAATIQLKAGQYSNAETIFEQLINDPNQTENPNRLDWILAAAQTKFEQENFAGAIAALQTSLSSISEPTRITEALYLVGISHYQLQQYQPATENLTRMLAIDQPSTLSDKARLYLGLSQLQQNQYELAKESFDRLAADSPNSPLLNQAYVQLGNNRYQANQQTEAIALFQTVIAAEQATAAEKASAIHGAAWAHLKSENRDQAKRLFQQLIQTYPESALLASAKTGLASIDPSLVEKPAEVPDKTNEADRATATSTPEPAAVAELRKTGLAQVKAKQWAAAIESFEQLIQAAPGSADADADLYELAWAYRSAKQEAQAITYFGKITADHPTSRFATEANFHVGKSAYDGQRYDDAVKAFGACVGGTANTANATVREKAAYKLAWAYYKQDKFGQAHTAFTRQTELFPQSDLLADGKFMTAESLFRNQQFGPALVAYKAAKPIVDRPATKDQKLKWLTILHGAQCANQELDYLGTIDWTTDFETVQVNSPAEQLLKQDILLEIGKAYAGLKHSANAAKFWRLASMSPSETGAQASCLLGRQLRIDKQYDDAEREFKKVFFGFGGNEAKPAIRPWQAYARFEAARSNLIRAQATTDTKTKQAFLTIATAHLQALVDDYPDDKLAAKAEQELKALKPDSN